MLKTVVVQISYVKIICGWNGPALRFHQSPCHAHSRNRIEHVWHVESKMVWTGKIRGKINSARPFIYGFRWIANKPKTVLHVLGCGNLNPACRKCPEGGRILREKGAEGPDSISRRKIT